MSVKIYENGWRDISSLKRYENGWTDCQFARKYENGQWVDVWTAAPPPGMVVITESQTWTVPTGVKSIDLFLVGGGSGGSSGRYDSDVNSDYMISGGGGGGGYTNTIKGIIVSPGLQIPIIIGSGGNGGTHSDHHYRGTIGGTTSAVINSNTYYANGGTQSNQGCENGIYDNGQIVDVYTLCLGLDGGSGGGTGGYDLPSSGYKSMTVSGDGGSDGSDGSVTGVPVQIPYDDYSRNFNAGIGQHFTTRSFGESNGTLYSGGGGGGYHYNNGNEKNGAGGSGGGGNGGIKYYDFYKGSVEILAISGSANTGGGGGGGSGRSGYNAQNGAAGGSGVAIIRWGY